MTDVDFPPPLMCACERPFSSRERANCSVFLFHSSPPRIEQWSFMAIMVRGYATENVSFHATQTSARKQIESALGTALFLLQLHRSLAAAWGCCIP